MEDNNHSNNDTTARQAGLTDEQILHIARALPMQPWGIGSRIADLIPFAREILAAHSADGRPSSIALRTALVDAIEHLKAMDGRDNSCSDPSDWSDLESALEPQHEDDDWVDQFAAVMKAKLAAARAKGRGGWQTCSAEDLSRMLREHVEKGDPRDVANFSMFLWALGKTICPADARAIATHLPDYSWMNCPSEIVGDLCNEIDEARQQSATPADAASEADKRDAAHWFSLVMGAAASLEDAANWLTDPDSKHITAHAAEHYRAKANAAIQRERQQEANTESKSK